MDNSFIAIDHLCVLEPHLITRRIGQVRDLRTNESKSIVDIIHNESENLLCKIIGCEFITYEHFINNQGIGKNTNYIIDQYKPFFVEEILLGNVTNINRTIFEDLTKIYFSIVCNYNVLFTLLEHWVGYGSIL